MNKNRVAKAIALQVKECGCSHCRWIASRALGTSELIGEFFKKYDWDGR